MRDHRAALGASAIISLIILIAVTGVAIAGTTERVSVSSTGEQANNISYWFHAVTPDGRYVVFTSDATNLIPEEDGNYGMDAFVRDRQTGTTERVSLTASGDYLYVADGIGGLQIFTMMTCDP